MKKRTLDKVESTSLILAFFTLVGLAGYMLFESWNELAAYQVELPEIVPVQVIPEQAQSDIETINFEVINITKQYFEFPDNPNLRIENPDVSVWESNYILDYNPEKIIYVGAYETIRVGIGNIKSDFGLYRMVMTHEYMHHVLFMLNIPRAEKDLDEDLADTFTWWTNKEVNERTWGKNNEGRHYPYNITITPILVDNNFDCLDKVFVKSDKIESVQEYKERLIKYCNSTFDGL